PVTTPPRGHKRPQHKQRPQAQHHHEIQQLGDRPGATLVGVEHLIQRRAKPAEQPRGKPEEEREAHRGQADTLTHDARQGALDLLERPLRGATDGGGQQAGQQLVQLHLMGGDLMLHQIANRGQEQRHERDDGEKQVERQSAGEEGDVVFEGRFEGAAGDPGQRLVPAAFGLHATGSSPSSGRGRAAPPLLPGRVPRRRRLASPSRRSSAARVVAGGSSASSTRWRRSPISPALSAARSRRPRRRRDSRPRETSPGSGANRKPSTAPRLKPSRNGPNAPPPRPPSPSPPPPSRSLIRPPRDRPGPRSPWRAAARATAAAA